jgi:hypothetical protein
MSDDRTFVALPRSGSPFELREAVADLQRAMDSGVLKLKQRGGDTRLVDYIDHLLRAAGTLDPGWWIDPGGGLSPGGSSPGGSSPGGSSPGGSSPGGSSPGGSSPGGSSPGGSSPGGSSPGGSSPGGSSPGGSSPGGSSPGGSSPGGSSPGGSSPGGSSPGGSSPGGSSPGGSSPGGFSPGGSSPGGIGRLVDQGSWFAGELQRLGSLIEGALVQFRRQAPDLGEDARIVAALQDAAGQLAGLQPGRFSGQRGLGGTSPFEPGGQSFAPRKAPGSGTE